ncbi:MarR family winged helix-turn-helix transcriptional regulator [Iamia majanohamensis]|uniref:MarR family winged helix-turn-helix transcriptional regulator n=1 Tax=Iamia majanohamensis TaxID=467976 RepID=A0AAE9Y5W1_9ACTN|nr:MarR family winged helix-turn-helix transcriptional regulator [Iamia majanohamensis]WCO67415.1 MarR family winged helix-turn-helix transcriptional regulator [Iamia majanohamensis]
MAHADTRPDAAEAARAAWATISHLFMQSAGRFEGIAADLGLAHTDLGALLHLDPEATPSQGELAESWGCDASWVTAKVDTLEEAGLVTRVPDSRDRRRKTVVITDEGRRAQAAALARLYEPPEALTALGDDDLVTLAGVLSRVEVDEDAGPPAGRGRGRAGGPPKVVAAFARAQHARHAAHARGDT